MKYAMQFTAESRNEKTGPIPVSTSSNQTCPDDCPLKVKGCYAKNSHLGVMWAKLSSTTAGDSFQHGRATVRTMSWGAFIDAIHALADDTLWRHNQAGDLPGDNNAIDHEALNDLVRANRGKRGFTYTHKPLTETNAASIRDANKQGFTINLSADNLNEADELSAANVGPVVTLLPEDVQGNVKITTPAGRRVAVCPATYRDDVTCQSCGLCQRQDRKVIVGFPAHGATKKSAGIIARN